MSNKSKSDNWLSLEAKNKLIATRADIKDNTNIIIFFFILLLLLRILYKPYNFYQWMDRSLRQQDRVTLFYK